MLLKLNMAFFRLFKFVNHDFRLHPKTNHGMHYNLKDKIIPTLLFKLVSDELAQVKAKRYSRVEVEIAKSAVGAEETKTEGVAEASNDSIFD